MKSTALQFALPVRNLLLCSAALFGLAIPAAVRAQDGEEASPAADAPDESEGEGNEIIVTATKREQTLQDVPIAVSVTTAESIERAQIRDLKDLSSLVPSLRIGERQTSANTNFFIRGFGNGANNAGIEPSVGVFVDGVYRSRSAAQITDLPDVQRVEVLRGPQSTLFGKNASAGVVSIITQKPKFTFGGNFEASYGNYNAIVAKGLITGPLSETVAASFAAGYNKRDGYNKNLATGNRVNERDRWFVRGQLLFKGDSGLTARLIADYSKIDENCCGVFNVQEAAPTQIVRAVGGNVNLPAQRFDNVLYFDQDPTNKVDNYGISGQIDYETGPLTITSITAWRKSKTVSQFDIDFTSADLLRGANISLSDIDTFTQELRFQANLADQVNVLFGAFYFNEKIRQNGEQTWGAKARPYANALVSGLSGGAQTIPGLEGLFGAVTGQPTRYLGQFFAPGQGRFETDRMKNENFTIFSQVDFKVTDRLTLTGGISYTHDTKNFSVNVNSTDVFAGLDLPALRNAATNAGIAQTIGPAFGVALASPAQIATFAAANPAQFAAIQTGAAAASLSVLKLRPLQFLPPIFGIPNAIEPGRTKDHKFTYTARLAYDVTDDINAYLSYATGYKASSVNLSFGSRRPKARAAAIQTAGIGVVNQDFGTRFAGPESAEVFEGGIKAKWSTGSVNIAAFYEAIKGFQSNIFTGTTFVLANAGKQSVYGAEFDAIWRPVRPLSFGLAMTFLHPKYDDFKQSAFGDATGIRPSDIPGFSGTFSVDYDHELANSNHLIFHGDFHHESKVQVIEGLPAFIAKDSIPRRYCLAVSSPDSMRPSRSRAKSAKSTLRLPMR